MHAETATPLMPVLNLRVMFYCIMAFMACVLKLVLHVHIVKMRYNGLSSIVIKPAIIIGDPIPDRHRRLL